MLRRFPMATVFLFLIVVGAVQSHQRQITTAQVVTSANQQSENQFIAIAANQVYLMPADGSKPPRQLTRFAEMVELDNLAWSPDGKKIAFTVFGLNASRSIYVIDADGSRLTNLTPEKGFYFTPVWSPDGRKIAFSLMRGTGENKRIYVMNAAGSNPILLTNPAYDSSEPQWSPDGRYIVYSAQAQDAMLSQIYVMESNGANVTNITNTKFDEYSPTWSPDGRQIAFVSEQQSKSHIYIMNADGTNQVNLTNSDFHDARPTWSPDGRYIAFLRGNSSPDDNELYVINPDGSHLVHVENRWRDNIFIYQVLGFAWSPDGQRIALTFLDMANGRHDIYMADVSCIDAQQPCTAVPIVNLTIQYDVSDLDQGVSLAWSVSRSK